MHIGIFDKRVAIVTGGASGIGRAIAETLIDQGARVAIWDTNAERLARIEAHHGAAVLTRRVDVADFDSVRKAMEETQERLGAPHLLVNNAGIIGRLMPLADLDEENLDRVIAVNLKSNFYVSHMFQRASSGADRAIVNLSSIAARTGGMAGNMVYAATKGAIASLTVSLAKELAPEIRVNALAPGVIDTEIQGDVFGDKEMMNRMFSQIPLKRAGTPQEVANAACWLLSPAASYLTGAVIDVSGGR